METKYSLVDTESYSNLVKLNEELKKTHLKELLKDKERTEKTLKTVEDLVFDFSHAKVEGKVLDELVKLADEAKLKERIESLFNGEVTNFTEGRSVLHTALRAEKISEVLVEGKNVVPGIHEVLDRVSKFSESIREGEIKGASGKKFKNIVSIGIGGSYLGVECVYEALKNEAECKKAAGERKLQFLANICPIDFASKVKELDAEETLFIIVSKTFTTAETMQNAKACKVWLENELEKKVKP